MQDSSLKQRLAGAIVLVFLGVIVIPMLLSGEGPAPITQSNIPPPPKSEFSSKIIPLDEVPAAGTLNPVPISPPAASVEQPAAPAAAAPSPAKNAATAEAPVVPVPAQAPAKNVTPTAVPVVPAPVKSASPAVAPPAAAVNKPADTANKKPAAARAAEAWVVRLGSFASEQNALALRDKLRSKGYKALVEKVTTRGVPLLRVSVGPEAQRARAEAVRDRLQKELNIKGNVVQYP
ncbi:MAG: SPOR domain-containing protein [Proteobacteria bacterium]|nr:SPOR domain-containing protein [Pseudomonadota bacterium]